MQLEDEDAQQTWASNGKTRFGLCHNEQVEIDWR